MRRHNKANDATDPDTGRPSPDPSGQVNRGSGRAAWAAAAAVAAVGVAAWAARDVPAELGSRYTGDRALGARGARIRESAQFSAGAFHNPIPAKMLPSGSAVRTLADMLASRGRRTPSAPVPVVTPQAPLAGDQEQGKDQLHITWYGHASTLVEIDGRRVLFDPVWSDRCSPSRPGRAEAAAPAAGGLGELPRRRDRHLPRPLRPPRHGDGAGADRDPDRAVPGAAGRRRAPRTLGRAGRPDHRAGLGRERARSPACA